MWACFYCPISIFCSFSIMQKHGKNVCFVMCCSLCTVSAVALFFYLNVLSVSPTTPKLDHTVAEINLFSKISSKDCFDNEKPNLFTLSEAIQYHLEKKPACLRFSHLLKSLYTAEVRQSEPLVLPMKFASRVFSWLGNSTALMHQVNNQTLIHVSFDLTGEYVVYNPLRGQRPMPKSSSGNMISWLEKIAQDTKASCDFCSAAVNTASDRFGRHVTNSSIRVSNTFKMEKFHGMVVTMPTYHHPTDLPLPIYTAFLADAVTLAAEMSSIEAGTCFTHIAWDTLPKAGASQVHPHIHVLVAPHSYYGYTGLFSRAAVQYSDVHGESLISVLTEVHEALGLAVTYGAATVIALLVGKGELELMFISEKPDSDLFTLMYFATKAYHKIFQQYCYSLAGSWPAEGCLQREALPVIIRMMARGDCHSESRSDYSSFELYQATYRKYDPWAVIAAVREIVFNSTI